MMENKFTSAVIVCAGNSVRMGKGQSKVLMELCGKPVISYSLGVFEECSLIDEIIVVCRKEDEAQIRKITREIKKPLKITEGGETRQSSVMNGVLKTDEECTHLVIHDGARPLITKEEVRRVIEDGQRYGAATLSTPLKDTVKLSDENGFVLNTPKRDRLFAAQTPQVFEKNLYKETAFRFRNKSFTDDSLLIENAGGNVYLSKGEYTNIKITTPEDLLFAAAILNGRKEGEK